MAENKWQYFVYLVDKTVGYRQCIGAYLDDENKARQQALLFIRGVAFMNRLQGGFPMKQYEIVITGKFGKHTYQALTLYL